MLPSPHLGRYWPALLHAASQMFSGLPNISTVRGSDNQTLLSGTCLAGGGPGLNWRGASFPVPLRLCMGSLPPGFIVSTRGTQSVGLSEPQSVY